MGEVHPGEARVVVEFCTADLSGLTKVQREKLIKLAGPRYNPETDIVKMYCESHSTREENKNLLKSRIRALLAEAKVVLIQIVYKLILQNGADTLSDLPLDFRHHKFKKTTKFPKEWEMTPERSRQLKTQREEMAALDAKDTEAGGLLNGTTFMAAHLLNRPGLAGAELSAPTTVSKQRR
jgi:small subunit ribosomal protein S35